MRLPQQLNIIQLGMLLGRTVEELVGDACFLKSNARVAQSASPPFPHGFQILHTAAAYYLNATRTAKVSKHRRPEATPRSFIDPRMGTVTIRPAFIKSFVGRPNVLNEFGFISSNLYYFFCNVFRCKNIIDASTSNSTLRHIRLLGRTQILRNSDASDFLYLT